MGTSFLAITDRHALDGDRLLRKIVAEHWPESHQHARHQDLLRISPKINLPEAAVSFCSSGSRKIDGEPGASCFRPPGEGILALVVRHWPGLQMSGWPSAKHP